MRLGTSWRRIPTRPEPGHGRIHPCGLGGAKPLQQAVLQKLIDERQDARHRRDFDRGDEIRDQLAARGIILEDTKDGVRWKRK